MYEVGFGEWLSRRRKALGLTQRDLANQVNCAVITLRKIEAEQRRPSAQIAERLGQILAIPAIEQKAFLRYARGEWNAIPSTEILPLYWEKSTSLQRASVPAHYTPFIGRKKELDELSDYLQASSVRLVSLVGAPGVGKSRLGSEILQTSEAKFSGGTYYIPLAHVHDPGTIMAAVLQALGAETTARLPDFSRLFAEIADQRILLLLDDVDQLLPPVRTLVNSLILNCPSTKILVTSREPLHLVGEKIIPLEPLEVPDDHHDLSMNLDFAGHYGAVELFTSCARIYQPGFSITAQNVSAIASICGQLDGLPLAVELLASRLRLMTPQSLLAHLSSQFILQSAGPGYLPKYQKTLQHSIDRSFSTLSLDEKRLFTYLSIFEGDFTLEMVEAAFSATPAHNVIADLMSSLLDKSMVQASAGAQAEPHFKLLKVLHRYAAVHLKDFEQDAMAGWQFPPDMVKISSRVRMDIKASKEIE